MVNLLSYNIRVIASLIFEYGTQAFIQVIKDKTYIFPLTYVLSRKTIVPLS